MSRYQDVAEQYLEIVLRGPVEYMCRCPFCDGASSLQFNIERGLWTCFRCSDGGGAKSLVKRLGGRYVDPAVSVDLLHMQFDRLRTINKKRYQEDDLATEYLPETTLLRYGGPTHEYWKSRKFTEETVRLWDLGYDPLTDRCTIPYRTPEGELLGVIQRRLDDVFPRYIYPKEFDRAGALFGSWNFPSEESNTTSLVEGSTDVIKVCQAGRTSLGQYGSSIGPRQVELLKRLGVERLILFYDYDEAGRKALEDAQKKCGGFLLAKVVWDTDKYCWHKNLCGCGEHEWRTIAFCNNKIPCKCGRKHGMDPGKLSPKEIRKMYDNPKRVGSRRKENWRTHRSASLKNARRKAMED